MRAVALVVFLAISLLPIASTLASPPIEEWLSDQPRAFVRESRPWAGLPIVEHQLGLRWGEPDALALHFEADWLSAGAYGRQVWRLQIQRLWASVLLGVGLEEWSEKVEGGSLRARRRPRGTVQWKSPSLRLGIAFADPVGAGIETRLAGRIAGDSWRFTVERQSGRWGGEPRWGGRLELLFGPARLLFAHLGERASVGAEIRRGSLGLSFEEETNGPRLGGRSLRLAWWAL